jgi:hypothetical protein
MSEAHPISPVTTINVMSEVVTVTHLTPIR